MTNSVPSPDIRMLSALPYQLESAGQWDDLFYAARSTKFLSRLAQEIHQPTSSVTCTSPLVVLDLALEHAIKLDRVAEMAAFTLSRSYWTTKLAAQTPLDAVRAGNAPLARNLIVTFNPGRVALWYLLLAWEMNDAGNPGGARQLLLELLRQEPPMLRARDGRRAVLLLRHAIAIDEHAVAELQVRLLDDNDRLDLCRHLIDVGDLRHALPTAKTIGRQQDRVAQFAAVARAQAVKGDHHSARVTIELALDDLLLTEPSDERAVCLAQIAGAQALCDDREAAEATFSKAAAAAEELPDPTAAHVRIASEQAKAGLGDSAESTAAKITNLHDRWEALEAVALGRARAGQLHDAVRLLSELELYVDYPRAVRSAARFLIGSGYEDSTVQLAMRIDRHERDRTLATIANLLGRAGQARLALQLARNLEDPYWRARALTKLVAEPSTRELAASSLSDAIAEVTSAPLQAELLAEMAVTQNEHDRAQTFEAALNLTASADEDKRWEVLASIALAQYDVGIPEAATTFAAARRAIRESEPDPEYYEDELWRLGTLQDEVGDGVGARDSFADTLQAPVSQPEVITDVVLLDGRWLRSVALAGVAVVQAKAGDTGGARQTIESASQAAAELGGEMRELALRAIAEAQAEVGDFAAALETAGVLILVDEDEADEGEDEESEEDELGGGEDWSLIVKVALKLGEAGDRDHAREVLRSVANKAATALGREQGINHSEVITELACAQARIGDLKGALETADLDDIGEAAGPVEAAIAKVQARSGDTDSALQTARNIRRSRWQGEALRTIGMELAVQGDDSTAKEVFAEAAHVAKLDDPGRICVAALIEISKAQSRIDVAAAHLTLTEAREIAQRIQRSEDEAQALSAITQTQAALGDIDGALETAEAIDHPWFSGESLCHAAVYAGAQSREPHVAATIVNRIENPWWRSAGLAVVAAGMDMRGDPDAWSYWSEADKLMSLIPEGEARSRLREVAFLVFLESGNYDAAVRVARKISADANRRLPQVANLLIARGAVTAFKNLLPDCARFVDAAFLVCGALAHVYPDQCAAIAAEILNASS